MAQSYGVDNIFEPLTIAGQGSFTAGGVVVKDSLGHTFHGDHAYVFYQIPTKARRYPLVFVHGIGQSGKTWKPHLMDVKDFKRSFSVVGSKFIWWTNREEGVRDAAHNRRK